MDLGAIVSDLSLSRAALLSVVAAVAYLTCLAVYRLYLHPLANFPGPKLAALTSWYEGYYEICLKGQYSRKISELHDIYGMYNLTLTALASRGLEGKW